MKGKIYHKRPTCKCTNERNNVPQIQATHHNNNLTSTELGIIRRVQPTLDLRLIVLIAHITIIVTSQHIQCQETLTTPTQMPYICTHYQTLAITTSCIIKVAPRSTHTTTGNMSTTLNIAIWSIAPPQSIHRICIKNLSACEHDMWQSFETKILLCVGIESPLRYYELPFAATSPKLPPTTHKRKKVPTAACRKFVPHMHQELENKNAPLPYQTLLHTHL